MKKVLSLVLTLCILCSTMAGMGTIFAEDILGGTTVVCSDSSRMYVSVEAYASVDDAFNYFDDEEFVQGEPIADGEFVIARVFMEGILAYNVALVSLGYDPAKVKPCTISRYGEIQYVAGDEKFKVANSICVFDDVTLSGSLHIDHEETPNKDYEDGIFVSGTFTNEMYIQTSADASKQIGVFMFQRQEGATLDNAIWFYEPQNGNVKDSYTSDWVGPDNQTIWSHQVSDRLSGLPVNHVVPSAFVIDGVGGTVTPPAPVVTSVVVNVDDTELYVGDTANVTVTANYDDGNAVDVTAEATVSVSEGLSYENGVITANAAGDATVTATYENVTSDAVAVLVEEVLITVDSVIITVDDTELTVGDTANVTVTANFSDGGSADVTADATVVVSNELSYENGVITANAKGNATVNASFDGVDAEPVTVVVSDPIPAALTSIALAVDTASLNVNGTTNVTVTGTYDDGTTKDVTADAEITFGTAGVATYAAGVITAVAAGTTTVKATVGEFSSNEVALTVKARPSFSMVPGEVYEVSGKKYVDVAFDIASNPGVCGYRFELAYDKTALTPVTEYSNVSEDSPYYQWEEDGLTPFYHVPVAQEGLWTGWAIRVIDLDASMSESELDVTRFFSVDESRKNNRKNGTWFTVTFEISDTAEGEYPIEFVFVDFSNAVGDGLEGNIDFNDCTITVEGEEQVVLAGIEVAVDAESLYVGETANVTVTASYTDGTTADVTADATIAVSEELAYEAGVITAVKAGQATISASFEGQTAEASVLVEEVPVTLTGIEVAVDDDALFVGETANVTVTATYSDGTTADITGRANVVVSDELTYANGVITAAKAGQATVTVTYEGLTAEASVVVENVPVTLEGIEVVVDADALTVGETANVTVTATYSDGTTADVTADATVAVSEGLTYENGVITAAKAGTATITVTYEGATAEASVEVEEIVVSVKVKGNVYMDEVEINLNDVTLLAKFLAKWESAIETFENEDVKYNANVYRADQTDINADFGNNEAGVTLYINSKDITKLLQFVNEIGVDDADKVWNVDLNAAN